jgi:hypothetical protein
MITEGGIEANIVGDSVNPADGLRVGSATEGESVAVLLGDLVGRIETTVGRDSADGLEVGTNTATEGESDAVLLGDLVGREERTAGGREVDGCAAVGRLVGARLEVGVPIGRGLLVGVELLVGAGLSVGVPGGLKLLVGSGLMEGAVVARGAVGTLVGPVGGPIIPEPLLLPPPPYSIETETIVMMMTRNKSASHTAMICLFRLLQEVSSGPLIVA